MNELFGEDSKPIPERGVKKLLEDVTNTLKEVLSLWEAMKYSDLDDAGDDADRFQMMFYVFIEQVRSWVTTMDNAPMDIEEARQHLSFAALFEAMPDPLQIPFENELDSILNDQVREVDSTQEG